MVAKNDLDLRITPKVPAYIEQVDVVLIELVTRMHEIVVEGVKIYPLMLVVVIH